MKPVAAGLLPLLLAGVVLPGRAEDRRRVSAPSSFYDDADIPSLGWLSITEDFSYVRVPAGRALSFPSASISLAVSRRVGFSGTISYARSTYEDSRINAIGDSYAEVKLLLVPQHRRRPAVAFEPMIEVLGKASIADNPLAPDRVNYILPVILQASSDSFRLYNTSGYATRGIVFDSAVFELTRWSRITPIAVVSASRMTRELGLISDLGLNRSRIDLTAGAAIAIRPHCSVYINTGRTLGRIDENATRYQVSGGVTFDIRLWGKHEP
jgi:hypothetical protein